MNHVEKIAKDYAIYLLNLMVQMHGHGFYVYCSKCFKDDSMPPFYISTSISKFHFLNLYNFSSIVEHPQEQMSKFITFMYEESWNYWKIQLSFITNSIEE
jgi:hypothetical protein